MVLFGCDQEASPQLIVTTSSAITPANLLLVIGSRPA